MAQHKSAEKQARQSVKRNLANRSYMSKVKTAVKKFLQSVDGEKKASKEETLKLFTSAQSFLMKASTKGIVHKNNASRHISRLSRVLVKSQQA